MVLQIPQARVWIRRVFFLKKRSFHLVEEQVPALKPGEKPVGCLFRWCEAVLTQMLKQTSVS